VTGYHDSMVKKFAEDPFFFTGCWELREMLGRNARDEQQLLEIIEEVPLDSIYYHTHSFFLRHKYIAGPYPNDFATWAAIQVRDRVLGERLAVLDPHDFDNLEALRNEIVTIIEGHLSRLQTVPRGRRSGIHQEKFFNHPAPGRLAGLDELSGTGKLKGGKNAR
jgi:hypothetical protein